MELGQWIFLEVRQSPESLSLDVDANPGGTGALFFSLDGDTTGSAKPKWDICGGGLGGGLGVDITMGLGDPFFTFDIIDIDQGAVNP